LSYTFRVVIEYLKIMKSLLLVAAIFVTTNTLAALPAPAEIPKNGGCPSGYSEKGNQCVPSASANFAIVKSENCPEAYIVDGNYCVATAAARLAIKRGAMSCPAGFEPIGNYCVATN
jgi:hypothetical protein